MAEKTGISWTDSTFNPWIGCTKVGPGCDHCYAEALMDKRWHRVEWGVHGERVRTSAANWRLPLQWERDHQKFFSEHGRRQRVFCASLADVFDNKVDPQWRRDLFQLIHDTPHLDWLLLTKRIGNVPKLSPNWGTLWLNVWLGITVVNQEEADRDIPKLLAVPARVKFLSCEPLLGPLELSSYLPIETDRNWLWRQRSKFGEESPIHWVIVGGESGKDCRPMNPEWAMSIRDQCTAAGVPFFFKQWGGQTASAGGCELNGAEHKAWPMLSTG